MEDIRVRRRLKRVKRELRPPRQMRRRFLHVCVQLLERVNACNTVAGGSQGWLQLVVEQSTVGGVALGDADALCAAVDGVFEKDVSSSSLRLAPSLEAADASTRTEAVAGVTAKLRDQGVIRGWRDELVPVASGFGDEPKFLVERAAYPLLGTSGYGVHVNGFVQSPDGTKKLWVGRRAKTKQTWPGMLDHVVAGHVSHGLTPTETVVKEAGEEAGIAADLAERARPAGAVSYTGVDEEGRLKNDCLFCFDLQLPSDFEPVPVDGEVDEFYLWDLDTVIDKMIAGEFKPNVVLVIVDFLIRHGHHQLSPDDPGYLELVASLRQGDCR